MSGTPATRAIDESGFQGRSGTQRGFGGWFVDTGWRHLVAVAALLFALFPVYWVVIGAFDSSGSLATQDLVPEDLSLDNFRALLSDEGHPPFWTWFWNSMKVCFATSIGTVFLCATAGYAFSRMRFIASGTVSARQGCRSLAFAARPTSPAPKRRRRWTRHGPRSTWPPPSRRRC